MKILCPSCEKEVPADNIDLKTGWGKCARCNDIFPLSDVLDGYSPPGESEDQTIERPFDAWARLERADNYLAVYLPPKGMRFATWSILCFAASWLGFIAFWTAGALGFFFNKGQPPNLEEVLFACFSIPFWLVGFGMLGLVLWQARSTRAVYIDAENMVFERTCSIWRRRRAMERSRVQHARATTKTSRNEGATDIRQIAEIVFEKGSFALPCETKSEQLWLVGEINSFLKRVPARSGSFDSRIEGVADDPLRRLKSGASTNPA
jgi:hypothetical protein